MGLLRDATVVIFVAILATIGLAVPEAWPQTPQSLRLK
jgi:hypothetical protein